MFVHSSKLVCARHVYKYELLVSSDTNFEQCLAGLLVAWELMQSSKYYLNDTVTPCCSRLTCYILFHCIAQREDEISTKTFKKYGDQTIIDVYSSALAPGSVVVDIRLRLMFTLASKLLDFLVLYIVHIHKACMQAVTRVQNQDYD